MLPDKDTPKVIQNLAFCYLDNNRLDIADSLYNQALTLLEKQVGKVHPMYANTLQNRAGLLTRAKKYTEALQLRLDALALAKPTPGKESEQYAQMIHNTALDYLALGELLKADSLIKMALVMANRATGENTIAFATFLFVQGQIKCGDEPDQAGMGLMEEALRRYEFIFYRNFLSMSAQQKAAFVGKWKGKYEHYYSMVMDSHMAGHSYDVSLSQKSMLLNEYEQVASALNQSSNQLIKSRSDSLIKVKNRIATQYTLPIAQRKSLDSLEARAEILEKDLARQSASFRQARQALQVRWQDVRDALKPTEAAVEFISFSYHNGRQQTDSVRYMALVLRPGDAAPQVVSMLTDETPLRQLLARKKGAPGGAALYATRGSELDTDQLTKGDSLYQLIWQPIDSLLRGTKTVYLAPSGLLHQVSFAALPYRPIRLKKVTNTWPTNIKSGR